MKLILFQTPLSYFYFPCYLRRQLAAGQVMGPVVVVVVVVVVLVVFKTFTQYLKVVAAKEARY